MFQSINPIVCILWCLGLRNTIFELQIDNPLIGINGTIVTDALLTEVNYLTFTLTSGSRFCTFIDWDDNLVDEECFDDITDLAALGHLYVFIGF